MAHAGPGPQAPARQPRRAGSVPARLDVQGGGRHRRARAGGRHAVHRHDLYRRHPVRQPLLPLLEEGRARRREPAPRDRRVVRRLLLPGGAAPRRRRDCGVRAPSRPRAPDRCATRAREVGHHPRHAVEAAAVQPAVVRGRDAVGRDRAGVRDGDAAPDGESRRDARERRHSLPPLLREAGRGARRHAARGDRARGAERGAPEDEHAHPDPCCDARRRDDGRRHRQEGACPRRRGGGEDGHVAGREDGRGPQPQQPRCRGHEGPRLVHLVRARRGARDRDRLHRRARRRRRGRLRGAGRAAGPRALLQPEPGPGRARRGRGGGGGAARLTTMRFDRRLITHFEWLLPLLALAVCALGAATVYSATHVPGTNGFSSLALRQLMWLGGGFAAMLAVLSFDYRRLERSGVLIYGLVLAGVLIVPVIGRVGGGSRRWIPLGPVSIQPSEFMKLALVLVLARYFAGRYERRLGLRAAIVPLLLMAIPAAAILAQPDLGSAAVLGIVAVTMLVLGGVRLRWLVAMAAPAVVAAPLLWRHLK